jgi:hypothetical protein
MWKRMARKERQRQNRMLRLHSLGLVVCVMTMLGVRLG